VSAPISLIQGRVTENDADKLYLQSLGGTLFHTCLAFVFVLFTMQPIIENGFLAYWSEQYEIHPFEEVHSGL
jgi:hypothetical protein